MERGERERERGRGRWSCTSQWESVVVGAVCSSTSDSFYPSVLEERGGTSPLFFPLCGHTDNTTPRLGRWFFRCIWLPFIPWASLAEHPPPLTVSTSAELTCKLLSPPVCQVEAGGAGLMYRIRWKLSKAAKFLRMAATFVLLLLQREHRDY